MISYGTFSGKLAGFITWETLWFVAAPALKSCNLPSCCPGRNTFTAFIEESEFYEILPSTTDSGEISLSFSFSLFLVVFIDFNFSGDTFVLTLDLFRYLFVELVVNLVFTNLNISFCVWFLFKFSYFWFLSCFSYFLIRDLFELSRASKFSSEILSFILSCLFSYSFILSFSIFGTPYSLKICCFMLPRIFCIKKF